MENKNEILRKYSNGHITVVWKPALCIHSTICWKGLLDVFNPNKRPWVNPYGASTERIIEQIDKCPSQALSYYRNDETQTEKDCKEEEKTATETEVTVLANGPLLIKGNIKVVDKNGDFTYKQGATAFCRCGATKTSPYCDGSHEKINFKG